MLRLVPLSLALGTLLTGSAWAQTSPSAAPAAENPIVAPKPTAPAAPTPRRPRAISSVVAAQLAASSPKYTPPPPKPEPKPEDDEADMREIDKPRNGIIRLPKYVVQEPKPAVLSERAVNTPKGLTDIAVRRYIADLDRALNRFTIPLFSPVSVGGPGTSDTTTTGRALAAYAEDERLQNMSTLNDAARDASRVDPAQGAYIRRQTQETYMRRNDFGWSGQNSFERK